MFDVGFAEILLLSLVGLLVLGPERLPRVARTLGGLARKARGSWLNLRRSIEAEMRAEELKEPLQRFQDEIKSGVDGIRRGVDSIGNSDSGNPDSGNPDSGNPDSGNPDSGQPDPATRPGERDDRS